MFSQKSIKPLFIGLFVALLVLIIAIGFLMRSIHTFKNSERKIWPRNPLSIFSWSQGPLTKPIAKDVEEIDEWMTFGYINHRFSLPETLLADTLNIREKKYPNISLGLYAKKNNIAREEFISQVRTIVSNFISQVP